MKRTLVKTVGFGLFLLGIGVFLDPLRPIRKGDSVVMAASTVRAYRENRPELADDGDFQRLESRVERLAKWSQSQETAATTFRLFTSIVLVAAGLFLVHIGSWIPSGGKQALPPSNQS